MNLTPSGDYLLPGNLRCSVVNRLLPLAKCVPKALRNRFIERYSEYQVTEDEDLGDKQGNSLRKWEALQMPAALTGKAVLDVGCAEGFFSRRCAERGATPVFGIDSGLKRVLCARFLALKEGLDITYRMAVFPNSGITRRFDYVLCLSLLHHFFPVKSLLELLTSQEHHEGLEVLRSHLKVLRSWTNDGGQCIIEMPYEYESLEERQGADFTRFNGELLRAGFRSAACLGTWDHNVNLLKKKDRLIYVAGA